MNASPAVDAARVKRPGAIPLALLHGASGRLETWAPVLEAWDWADLWVPSLPGRGASAAIDHRSVDALTTWLLDALPQARPWLVGHSLGGAVALSLALRAPERIAGVVLVSSAARLKVAPAILDLARATTLEEPMPTHFAFGPHASEGVRREYRERSRGVPTETAVGDWLACDGFDERSRLAEVNVPLLAVWGSADALTPAIYQRRLVEAVPSAKGVELEGHGHMLPWEAPNEVATAVRDFVVDEEP